jgi:hypothetical protein
LSLHQKYEFYIWVRATGAGTAYKWTLFPEKQTLIVGCTTDATLNRNSAYNTLWGSAVNLVSDVQIEIIHGNPNDLYNI